MLKPRRSPATSQSWLRLIKADQKGPDCFRCYSTFSQPTSISSCTSRRPCDRPILRVVLVYSFNCVSVCSVDRRSAQWWWAYSNRMLDVLNSNVGVSKFGDNSFVFNDWRACHWHLASFLVIWLKGLDPVDRKTSSNSFVVTGKTSAGFPYSFSHRFISGWWFDIIKQFFIESRLKQKKNTVDKAERNHDKQRNQDIAWFCRHQWEYINWQWKALAHRFLFSIRFTVENVVIHI